MAIRVEAEVGKQLDCTVTGRLDHFGFGFDLDELAEPGNVVEYDGVAVVFVALASLFDGGDGVEPEPAKDRIDGLAIVDVCFEFLAGFRFRFHEWAFVRDLRLPPVVGRPVLAPDSKCLVGFRELAVGGIVIGILLSDRSGLRCPHRQQPFPEGVVIGTNLQLDFVHGRGDDGTE